MILQEKKVLSHEEAITNEVVASAHVENYAVKLFLWADKEDRASHFNKNVVKSFYSAGILFDVLTICTQSELSPENAHMRKYSKWKAAYIHNCLKNGETPMPGPIEGEEGPSASAPSENSGLSEWQEPQNPEIPNTQVSSERGAFNLLEVSYTLHRIQPNLYIYTFTFSPRRLQEVSPLLS